MKFRYLYFIAFAAGALSACYTEDPIVPTEGDEHIYSLPQGNHEYDKEIVEWYRKYGFYTVYDYPLGDLYWANINWDEKLKPGLGGQLVAKQADQAYVGQLLALFKEFFLDHYPDEWLKECMPLKIFLCSELDDVAWAGPASSEFGERTRLPIHRGYDNIAINGANQGIETMSETMKTEFMKEMNKEFLHILQEKGKLVMPEAFGKVSLYSWNSSFVALPSPSLTQDPFAQNIFKEGYLNAQTIKSGYSKDLAKSNDFYYWLDLAMSYSIANLESETAGWKRSDQLGAYYFNYNGILHPKRGWTKARKKYDIIVDYIQNDLGINLDRIRYPERFPDE